MSRQLDSRISAAFTDTAKSEDFEPLIADATAAAKAADATAAEARERAMDPRCPPAEVAAARAEMEDAQFRSDRLGVAVKRLRDRHKQVSGAEENQRRQIEYDRVTSARDKLADELASVYPLLAAKLADLLQRVAANNREIFATKLPEGGSRILEAELVARGLPGFPLGSPAVSIIEETRLPAWVPDPHQPYAYPVDDRLQQAAVVLPIRV